MFILYISNSDLSNRNAILLSSPLFLWDLLSFSAKLVHSKLSTYFQALLYRTYTVAHFRAIFGSSSRNSAAYSPKCEVHYCAFLGISRQFWHGSQFCVSPAIKGENRSGGFRKNKPRQKFDAAHLSFRSYILLLMKTLTTDWQHWVPFSGHYLSRHRREHLQEYSCCNLRHARVSPHRRRC